ncbi:MAG: transporter, partial [Limisphaerales bacterium]
HIAIASLVLAVILAAYARETNSVPSDKNGYNLFNPVPENLMRELSPDRPDETESAYTVDAGHYQLEMDFANFTYDKTDGTTTKAWDVGDFNFRVGLLNNVDLQLVYDNYLNVSTRDNSGNSTTQSGFGDFTTRIKINLWGDDGGKTAFALLPYVKFPTGTDNLGNNAVGGGVIFPLAVKLPQDFDLSLETALGFFQDEDDNRYHEEFIVSASLDHQIIGKLSGFLEFFSNFSTERHASWIGTVDTGLEYLVTKNIQLDCDCYFGVTRAANDFNPFAGITVRF